MFHAVIKWLVLAEAQCESLRFKLIGGLAVRRACYGVLRRENASRAVFGYRLLLRSQPLHFSRGWMSCNELTVHFADLFGIDLWNPWDKFNLWREANAPCS